MVEGVMLRAEGEWMRGLKQESTKLEQESIKKL